MKLLQQIVRSLQLLGLKGTITALVLAGALVSGVVAFMPDSAAPTKKWASLPGGGVSGRGGMEPAAPMGLPGDYFSGVDAQLPPDYEHITRKRYMKSLDDDAWDDEQSTGPTDKHGAPLFIPSNLAMEDRALFEQELAQHKEAENKFIADRTQAISASLGREIADIEASIAQARKSGSRTNEEISEAQAAVVELKKARAGLDAELAPSTQADAEASTETEASTKADADAQESETDQGP